MKLVRLNESYELIKKAMRVRTYQVKEVTSKASYAGTVPIYRAIWIHVLINVLDSKARSNTSHLLLLLSIFLSLKNKD